MIYVQGAAGLTQVSPKLTKEKIIAALGFTPADKNSFYEDESGALLIADEQGYVIARIDGNGLTTTKVSAAAIELNGEDLATKLQQLENTAPGTSADLSNYYTKEEVDNALNTLNPTVDLSNYYTKTEVDQALENFTPEGDMSDYALASDVETHTKNEDIHVTAEDKASWDAKSDFSGNYSDLTNAPHIVNDNEDEVIICDSNGNIILRATAEGLNVAAIYVNGQAMNNVLKFTINDKEYEVTPSTQRWSDWVAANPDKGFIVNDIVSICYDYVTDQYIHDVKPADFIIPGHKYTYTTY